MKVLLIVPVQGYEGKPQTFLSVTDFPVGFAYISASLKQAGHEVIGVNPNNKPQYDTAFHALLHETTKAIKKHNPDLIGIGGLCVQFAFLKDAMTVIRKATKSPIVLGGNIVSMDTEYIFNRLKPDYCIIGEGERAMVELANGVERHCIKNLGYWEDGKAILPQPDYNYGPIDDLPYPDYEPFDVQEMVDDYSMATRILYRYSRPYPRPFVILSARGCPFSCTFCVHEGGPRYRARSVKAVMDEIKVMHEKYKFNILIFSDELFAANKKRMRAMCEAIIEGKDKYGWDFDWMFQTHANSNLDEDTLRLAKESGCYIFSYGIESASNRVLESMNKKSTIEKVIKGIELAEKVGVGFSGNLLFGDPSENGEDIMASLEFWAEYGQSNQIFLTNLMPYPGSKLFDYCLERKIIESRDAYYDTIGRVIYRMTSTSPEAWMEMMQLIRPLEQMWLFVKSTKGRLRVDPETNPILKAHFHGGSMWEIAADCPYCGRTSVYREMMVGKRGMVGTGCQYCHRRIKILIDMIH